ncbi:hypothetical protein O3P69_003060 [Scylla paramamosain]|uniref:Uncharacterized protein n=1 Tax=Scylla paramamosain TaxID=85552 RepID=A0AAW0UN92_SCYPA
MILRRYFPPESSPRHLRRSGQSSHQIDSHSLSMSSLTPDSTSPTLPSHWVKRATTGGIHVKSIHVTITQISTTVEDVNWKEK